MWNVKEVLGNQYIYVSKNVTDDIAASNYFGNAAAWVSGAAVTVGQRVTSSSIQYKNLTGVNTTTAPASDPTNWTFDLDNYQTYNTTKTYSIGSKTKYNNLHYNCTVSGSTGAFQVGNWTQITISNRSFPYKLMNTAIALINSDIRFVSYEYLDTILNTATHNIYLVLSNGIWNETLTAPTKYVRIVGQSKWKTQINSSLRLMGAYIFLQKIYYTYTINYNIGLQECVMSTGSDTTTLRFVYKTIFLGPMSYWVNNYHMVNCYVGGLPASGNQVNTVSSIIKNNIFTSGTFSNLASINPGNCDYNTYSSIAVLNAIKSAYPLQNSNSFTGVTVNADYTLPVGSPLVGSGASGNNIGAEGVGRYYDNTTSLNSISGATYRNITKMSTALIRDQIGKVAQTGSTNTITLVSTASSVDNEYNGFRIYISAGVGSGQTQTISSYNGTTKIATISGTWISIPDSTSTYEILDGEVTSIITDLGSIKTISKLNTSTVNYFDLATSTIITQNVSTDDARNYNSELNYELKSGLQSNLSDGSWVKFKQDETLSIDSNGKGCGDSSYIPENIIANALTFRYFQVRIQLHK